MNSITARPLRADERDDAELERDALLFEPHRRRFRAEPRPHEKRALEEPRAIRVQVVVQVAIPLALQAPFISRLGV